MSDKFLKARLAHQDAISKAVVFDNEIEEENDENEDLSVALGKMVGGYTEKDTAVGQQISDFMMSGLAACLVCIEGIRKTDPVSKSCCFKRYDLLLYL